MVWCSPFLWVVGRRRRSGPQWSPDQTRRVSAGLNSASSLILASPFKVPPLPPDKILSAVAAPFFLLCWPLREKNFKKERKKRHGNCESRKTVAGPRDLSPKKSMKIFVPESRKTVTMTLKKLTDQMKNGLRARLAHCSESRPTANSVHREFRPRCSRRGKTREKIQGPKRQREAGQKTRKN